jgi:hypothetical protein
LTAIASHIVQRQTNNAILSQTSERVLDIEPGIQTKDFRQ